MSREIAARAQPEDMSRGRLLIHYDYDVWQTELAYLDTDLLDRTAKEMDEELVKKIFLK